MKAFNDGCPKRRRLRQVEHALAGAPADPGGLAAPEKTPKPLTGCRAPAARRPARRPSSCRSRRTASGGRVRPPPRPLRARASAGAFAEREGVRGHVSEDRLFVAGKGAGGEGEEAVLPVPRDGVVQTRRGLEDESELAAAGSAERNAPPPAERSRRRSTFARRPSARAARGLPAARRRPPPPGRPPTPARPGPRLDRLDSGIATRVVRVEHEQAAARRRRAPPAELQAPRTGARATPPAPPARVLGQRVLERHARRREERRVVDQLAERGAAGIGSTPISRLGGIRGSRTSPILLR